MKTIKLIIVIAFFSTQINAQRIIKPIVPIDDTILPTDYYTGHNIISGIYFSFNVEEKYDLYFMISNINNVKFGTMTFKFSKYYR